MIATGYIFGAWLGIRRYTILALGFSFLLFGHDAGMADPMPSSAHWSHINILDFGRGLQYISNSATRRESYDWFAARIDMAEGGADQNNQVKELKSRNPAMKVFKYRTTIAGGQSYYDSQNLPENYYLHFSEDTTLVINKSGKPVTINITGCPPPKPANAGCRVQTYIWTNARYAFNMGDLPYQNWMADELLKTARNYNADGLFLDEHAYGFVRSVNISLPDAGCFGGAKTRVISGGGIREYGGLKPCDNRLENLYNADIVSALKVFYGRLNQADKFLLINTAGYSLAPLAVDQIMAARGVTTELMYTANMEHGAFENLITLARHLASIGGKMDLYGNPCTDMSAYPGSYPSGRYSTGRTRARMWRLSGYYILKESTNSPGAVYLNTNLCINASTGIDKTEWLAAYEVNVGQPTGDAVKYQQGVSPAKCGAQTVPYTVWGRDYTNALVLLRAKDKWDCNAYDDDTAVTVDLPESMRILLDDGSLSPPTTTVRLGNSDAVILIKPPVQ